MNIAIIPARGGSKRIPRKNIKEFCGRPMITWPIKAAIESQCFDKIIVSTDDNEIASIAKESGAEVPFIRPQELSDDFTGTRAVINHAIKELEKLGSKVKTVTCIYATSPLIQVNDLKQAFSKLQAGVDFIVSVTNYEFPVQRSVKINLNGRIEPLYPEMIKKRSQDLEEIFHDAGQFYIGHRDAFIEEKPMFGAGSVPHIIPMSRVQDIDTPEDWKRAELMFQSLNI